MLNFDEDKQERWSRSWLKWTLQAWEIEVESGTVLSSWVFRTYLLQFGEFVRVVWRRVQLAQVLLSNHDLAFGWADQPSGHCDHQWLTLFLKNSKKTVLFVPMTVFPRRFVNSHFELKSRRLDRVQITRTNSLKAQNQDDDATRLFFIRTTLQAELAWMRRQPQRACDNKLVSIVPPPEKEVSGGVAERTWPWQTSRIGKPIWFQDASFAYEKQAYFCKILIS